jgi:hypothetical protein
MKTLLVLVSFFTATSAFAMGGKPLDSKGKVTVNETFAITSNYDYGNKGGARTSITLPRGATSIELDSSYEEKERRRSPIVFYNPNRHDDAYPTPVAILLSVSAGNQYAHLRLPLLKEDSQSLIPAATTGQQFDMLVSVKTVEGKSAPRHETQECQIKDRCYDGGYGYGDNCSYAMGIAVATVHDDLSTRVVSIKFLSGQRVLGTYAGSETEKDPQTDSVGACHLNVQR